MLDAAKVSNINHSQTIQLIKAWILIPAMKKEEKLKLIKIIKMKVEVDQKLQQWYCWFGYMILSLVGFEKTKISNLESDHSL